MANKKLYFFLAAKIDNEMKTQQRPLDRNKKVTCSQLLVSKREEALKFVGGGGRGEGRGRQLKPIQLAG